MVSGEALKKLQEQIAAWPMTQRFVVQQLIEDYSNIRKDLLAYKNTGLTPESVEALKLSMMGKTITEIKEFNGLPVDRLRELAEADRDGRLVVPPCKVGDVVYGFHEGKTILPMVAKWIETNTDGWYIAVQYAPMAPMFYRFSDFGKTVFLTREEAKKALEAMQNE